VIVRVSPNGASVDYRSWADWRVAQERPEAVWLRPAGGQCPICWGQRSIWESGPLGPVPVVCEPCDGTGRQTGGSARLEAVVS
jgi:hypothetical protein